MFGDAQPSVETIGNAWIFIAWLASLAVSGVTLLNQFRSQKREVRMVEGLTTEHEFERHVELNREEHSQLFAKLGGVERGLEARFEGRMEKLQLQMHGDLKQMDVRNEDRVAKLHDRCNLILSAVSRLEGRSQE